MRCCLLAIVAGCGTGETSSPHGTQAEPTTPVVDDRDGDGWTADEDCDDADPDLHTGADEHCDGVDEDCDGAADEDAVDAPEWLEDADGDGYGARSLGRACTSPADGAVEVPVQEDGTQPDLDCDDAAPDIHPHAIEHCDGVDEDCDPLSTEDGIVTVYSSVGVSNEPGGAGFALQSAVGAERDIVVCPGTYVGFALQDLLHAGSITVESLAGPESTVLEGDAFEAAHSRVIEVEYGVEATLVVSGFTIRGDGVWSDANEPDLTFRDCVFEGADDYAIRVEGSDSTGQVTLEATTFQGNAGAYYAPNRGTLTGTDVAVLDTVGRGPAFDVGAQDFTCTACVFDGNVRTEPPPDRDGGAALRSAGDLVLESSTFSGNSGAAALYVYAGTASLTDTVFLDNLGSVGGSAIETWWNAEAVTLTGGSIDGNSADVGGAAVYTRPGYLSLGTLTATGVDFGVNDPDDVVVAPGGEPPPPPLSYAYDGPSSFTCDETGCR
jgi:hypothetical protein